MLEASCPTSFPADEFFPPLPPPPCDPPRNWLASPPSGLELEPLPPLPPEPCLPPSNAFMAMVYTRQTQGQQSRLRRASQAEDTYPETPVTVGPVATSHSIGQYRFHCSVGMAHSLRAVRVCNDLRLWSSGGMGSTGCAIRVIANLSGRVPRLNSLGWDFPLGDAGGKLDVVVLLARTIPLCDPACGERWRGIRWPVSARGGRSSHCGWRWEK